MPPSTLEPSPRRSGPACRSPLAWFAGAGLVAAALVGWPALVVHGQPPPGASLSGRILMAGRGTHAGVTVLVDGTPAATTVADGSFSAAGLAPGKHGVRAARPRYVCVETTVLLASNQAEHLPDLDLPGGDTDGDGAVNLFDLVRVGADYGHRPPEDIRTDLNEDGATDLLDLVMIGAAYDSRCPMPWPITSPTPEVAPSPTSTPEEPAGPPDPGGAVQLVTRAEVTLADDRVDWHTVYAADGAEIVFHNAEEHAMTLVDPSGALRVPLAPGEHVTWRVPGPGIYPYHSEQDAGLEGVVVVPADPATAAGYFGSGTIKAFYVDNCGGCHGPERRGGSAPALLPENLPEPDDFYFQTIKGGRPGTRMPAWGELGLRDEETWGLLGYLRAAATTDEDRWTEADIRNSLTVLADESTLPDRPQHGGNMANLMLVTERENRSIALIDGDTHHLLAHIDAGYRNHGYAFPPDGDRWAYSLARDGWLYKLDLYTARAVRTVRAGIDSRGVAVSDDGRYLMVGNYVPPGAVLFDAATLAPLKVIVAEGKDPHGHFVRSRVALVADVAPDLAGPYFLLALKEAGQVWRVNFGAPDFPVDKLAGVGHSLHDGFLDPANRHLYVASETDGAMAVIDVVDWRLLPPIATGDTPHPGPGAVWQADGTSYAATTHAGEGLVAIWDLATNEVVGRIHTAGPGAFIRAAANSPYVWADAMLADAPHAITVFRKTKPFEVVKVITDGQRTLHPEFTADGRFAYVADWDEGLVRVYDAASLAQVATIPGLTTPTGIFNTVRRLERLGQ